MTVLTESFNQADSYVLGPDQTWVDFDGSPNRLRTLSNKLHNSHTTTFSSEVRTTLLADQYAQMEVHAAGNIKVTCRGATTTHYAAGYIGSSSLNLWKRISGTYTALGSATHAWTAGDVMKVEAVGTAIKVYINNVEKISVTDSSITGSGYGGVSMYNPTGTADNWEAGDEFGGDEVARTINYRRTHMSGYGHR